jgi:restriction system protein
MAIWTYKEIDREKTDRWSVEKCKFCHADLSLLHTSEYKSGGEIRSRRTEKRLSVCPVCGWWHAGRREQVKEYDRPQFLDSYYGASASLREFDLTDIKIPIEEVRSFLAARFERRFELHPRIFEETVASVFRDHGFQANVTAYRADGGIDAILERGTDTIGVQVKRYKNAIEVEQIRSLAGALVLKGLTHGMFVTTSSFQPGAHSAVQDYCARGYKIELLDSNQFYDALKLAQREMYGSFEEFPVSDCLSNLMDIAHHRSTYP